MRRQITENIGINTINSEVPLQHSTASYLTFFKLCSVHTWGIHMEHVNFQKCCTLNDPSSNPLLVQVSSHAEAAESTSEPQSRNKRTIYKSPNREVKSEQTLWRVTAQTWLPYRSVDWQIYNPSLI